MTFSSNYAVRFNMNIVRGSSTGKATEGPIFGINHGSQGYATGGGSVTRGKQPAGPAQLDGGRHLVMLD